MKETSAKSKNHPATTQREDAKALGVSVRTIRDWRDAGAPGFRPDGSLEDRDALRAWQKEQEESRIGSARGIEAERDEKIRKLKLANDRVEGRLIERVKVLERFHIAAAQRNAFRAKSEAEHPMRFAAAAGDVAACREIVRGIWDEICAIEIACSAAFEDPTP